MQFSERNSSQDVPAAFCEGAGVRRPSLQRECGLETCHAWIKSPWSPCHAGECLARNTGQYQLEHELELQTTKIFKILITITITEKVPNRAFSQLKAPTSTFKFKTLC